MAKKIQETRETHQHDHAEGAKYMHGAADELDGGGNARGEKESVSDDTFLHTHVHKLCTPRKITR